MKPNAFVSLFEGHAAPFSLAPNGAGAMEEAGEDRLFAIAGEEREGLWEKANEVWPHYAEYQTRTDRVIPVVVLERAA